MKLRKWVKVLLMIIAIVSLMFMGSECNDIKSFIFVELISISTFILSSTLLIKYGA